MLSEGNGDVRVCAINLIRTMRGAVPYERFKGLDPTMIDKPITDGTMVYPEIQRLLEIYEKRIDPNDINLVDINAEHGDLGVVVEARR